MWIRWILLIVLIYFLYRLLRPHRVKGKPGGSPPHIPKEDVMVQDPLCGTFIPRSQALEARSGDTVIHFCSARCRDQYLERDRR